MNKINKTKNLNIVKKIEEIYNLEKNPYKDALMNLIKTNDKKENPKLLIWNFSKKLEDNYIKKSTNLIKWKIFNMSSMIDGNTFKPVYNMEKDFGQYITSNSRADVTIMKNQLTNICYKITHAKKKYIH